VRFGAYLRDMETGTILNYLYESTERSGTKVRTTYVCEVVLPEGKVRKIRAVSVYDVVGPVATYEELTPLEVLAWCAGD